MHETYIREHCEQADEHVAQAPCSRALSIETAGVALCPVYDPRLAFEFVDATSDLSLAVGSCQTKPRTGDAGFCPLAFFRRRGIGGIGACRPKRRSSS